MAAVTQGRESSAPGGYVRAPRARYESEQQLRWPRGSFRANAERWREGG